MVGYGPYDGLWSWMTIWPRTGYPTTPPAFAAVTMEVTETPLTQNFSLSPSTASISAPTGFFLNSFIMAVYKLGLPATTVTPAWKRSCTPSQCDPHSVVPQKVVLTKKKDASTGIFFV